MKEKFLYVTRAGEQCDEGFSYALELAKSMNAAIAVLMVYRKGMLDTYDDVMAAVAFAEAGDVKTMREFTEAGAEGLSAEDAARLRRLEMQCRQQGIDCSCRAAAGDAIELMNRMMQNEAGITMGLLSPCVSEGRKGSELRRLIRSVMKPVVTIMRPVGRPA